MTAEQKTKIFEYGGKHFEPVRKFTEREKNESFAETTRKLQGDNALGFYATDNNGRMKYRYNYNDFYAVSGNSDCDIFRCVENEKLYLPCNNSLFEWLGEGAEDMQFYIDTCENEGWMVYCGRAIEISRTLPLTREVVGITASRENFVSDVCDYVNNYNADEHARQMIIDGCFCYDERPTVREFIQDAELLEQQLKSLAYALRMTEQKLLRGETK